MRVTATVAALLLSLLAACKPFDPKLLAPTPGQLTPRLPPAVQEARPAPAFALEAPAVDLRYYNDVNHLFEREVRETLTEPYGTPRCYLLLSTTTLNRRDGAGWTFLSGMTAGLLNLLGMPYGRTYIVLETKLDVLDQQQRLVASYRAQAEAKAVGSIFSRTNYRQSDRVVYLQAVRTGLEKIKPQLQADMIRVQPLLAADR